MIVAVQGINDLAVVAAGTALPAANANLLTTDISKFNRAPRTIMVEFWPSVQGILSVKITPAGSSSSTSAQLLGGGPISAGTKQQDVVFIAPGETVNFTFSATTGTYRLIVREV